MKRRRRQPHRLRLNQPLLIDGVIVVKMGSNRQFVIEVLSGTLKVIRDPKKEKGTAEDTPPGPLGPSGE